MLLQLSKIREIFYDIDSLYSLAVNGSDLLDNYNYYDTNLEFLLTAIVIFSCFYLAIFGVIVFIVRFRLRHLIKNKDYEVTQQGNILTVKFKKKPWRGFLFLVAELGLKSKSAGRFPVKFNKFPRSYLEDDELEFDLNHLPAGKYELAHIQFSFRDFLHLFNARWHFEGCENNKLFDIDVLHSSSAEKIEEIDDLKLKDAMETVLSNLATEGFFSTREYRPGDEIKKIHWKNTAKTRKLIVRIPEDNPVDDEDINIVLNFYSPMLTKYNHKEIISKFLTYVVAYLKLIVENVDQNMNLYINTLKPEVVRDFHLYNTDKIAERVMSHAAFQEKTDYSAFVKSQGLEESSLIVFSLSSDKVPFSEKSKRFIYKVSKDAKKPLRSRFKEFLKEDAKNTHANLRDHLWMNNTQGQFFMLFNHFRFMNNFMKKERTYLNDNSVIWLNDKLNDK